MAQLTWKNVDAPDLGRAAEILNMASTQVGAGAAGIGGALKSMREDQKNRRSAAALPILAGVQNEGDVAGALAQINQTIRPEDMNEEVRKAYLGLGGTALGYDATRAGTEGMRGRESRDASDSARLYAQQDQEARQAGDILQRKEDYRNGIIGTESGGDWTATNNEVGSSGRAGHTGRAQFGHDRFDEAKAAGTIPSDMTFEEFGSDSEAAKAAQMSAEDWHFSDLEKRLAPYVGSVVNGQTLDLPALVAMGHLGGAGGAIQYVESGGKYNPADSNGTSLSDYAGKHGGGGVGLADLVPEDNVLGMGYWDAQSDDAWAQEEDGYKRRRERDALALEDQAAAAVRQGQELAAEAARGVELSGDLPGEIADIAREKNVSPAVLEAALAAAATPSIQGTFALDSEDVVTGTPVSGAADTSISLFDARVRDFASTDETLRIQSNAQDYSNDPALVLTEKMGLTADDKGDTLAAIEMLRSDAKAEGISLSPSEAAALLYESAERSGFSAALFPGFEKWGETYYRPEAALAFARDYMTVEQKNKGNESLVDIENAKAASEQLRKEMATVMEGLSVATSRGDEAKIAKWSAKRDALEERALKIEGDNGAFLAPIKEATPVAEGSTDPIGTATSAIANTALQNATRGYMDLSTLATASVDTQIDVLQSAITTLQKQGGSPEQVLALEGVLEQVLAGNGDDRKALEEQGRKQDLQALIERRDGANKRAMDYLNKFGKDNESIIGEIGALQRQIDALGGG